MNRMRTLGLVAAMALGTALYGGAEERKESNFEFGHNRVEVSGMLTSTDSWQMEVGYHYMINRYIGVGGSFGGWKVYFEEGFPSGKNWDIESDDNKPYNLYLRPSVVLKSPALKVGQVDLGLFAEPGVMMNVPYTRVSIRQYTTWPNYEPKSVSTSKGQWCAVDVRAGVYANVGPCGISAGYMMSNLDVYSQYRHLSYNGIPFSEFYPQKSFMQGAYLTLSYYF
ncbi:MAG: hypothetical protein NC043_04720 [Muribaculaceae bacterium]|nr:hypothetical protein [Muribaculaceae bacterium]